MWIVNYNEWSCSTKLATSILFCLFRLSFTNSWVNKRILNIFQFELISDGLGLLLWYCKITMNKEYEPGQKEKKRDWNTKNLATLGSICCLYSLFFIIKRGVISQCRFLSIHSCAFHYIQSIYYHPNLTTNRFANALNSECFDRKLTAEMTIQMNLLLKMHFAHWSERSITSSLQNLMDMLKRKSNAKWLFFYFIQISVS